MGRRLVTPTRKVRPTAWRETGFDSPSMASSIGLNEERLSRLSAQPDHAHGRRVGHRMTGVTPRLLHDSGPKRMPRLTIQGSDPRSGVVRTGVGGYDRNGTICTPPALALRVRRFIDVSRIGDGFEWWQRSRGAPEFGMMHYCEGSDSAPDRIDAIRDLLADDLDLAEEMGEREMRRYE